MKLDVVEGVKKVRSSLALVSVDGKEAGTGFFVRPGLVVTCAHVAVRGELRVSTPYGAGGPATLVRTDKRGDVAVLSVPGSEWVASLELDGRNRPVGTEVYFMGIPFPGVFDPPLVMVHRSLVGNRYQLGEVDHYVLDAVVGEGYSGSPVFMADGLVCGMVTSRFDPLKARDTGGAPVSSLTFALTSRELLSRSG